MRILADIGGTYARFAAEENGAPAQVRKYPAADFKTFEDALAAYRHETGIGEPHALLIATAAHSDDKGIWRFVNKNAWAINRNALPVALILNDFEAAAWGLADMAQGKTLCLVGPGTGLGLAYVRGGTVQPTLGGHLPCAAVTEEQARVLCAVEKIKDRPGIAVYEDTVSGSGLFHLYRALNGQAQTPEAMFDTLDTPAGRDALRLFHEFFGLFAATVTVAGNSYGELYLTGGVLERLMEKKLFDMAHFRKFFTSGFVPAVQRALENTPVFIVVDPHLSLKGLLRAEDRGM